MKEIRTQTSIKAAPEKIWKILTEFENYSAWNPFIQTIKGEKKPGGRLEVFIQPPGASGMKFKPKVLVFEKNQELRWAGKMFFKGLFEGEHYFLLHPNERGTTDFIHGEKFRGILVPFIKGMLKKTREGFELMNQELKILSERP
jgi:hypothetical protein